MSTKEKLEERLNRKPKDFTWEELVSVFRSRGFTIKSGSGSRYKFIHEKFKILIILHKPHPENVVNQATIKDATNALKELDAYERDA